MLTDKHLSLVQDEGFSFLESFSYFDHARSMRCVLGNNYSMRYISVDSTIGEALNSCSTTLNRIDNLSCATLWLADSSANFVALTDPRDLVERISPDAAAAVLMMSSSETLVAEARIHD